MKNTIRVALCSCLIILSSAVLFTSCEKMGEETTTSIDMPTETVTEENTVVEIPDEATVGDTEEVTEDTSVETTSVIETTTEPPHEHLWSEWNTVRAANCSAEGAQERACACGEKETESIAILAHAEAVDAAVLPTCTMAGLTEGTHCTVCNEILVKQKEVAPLGHAEAVDAAVSPTCAVAGLTEGTHCAVCNEILVKQKEVAPLGHTEAVDAAVSPTCTMAGLTEGTHCAVCNEILVKQKEVAPLGHTEVIDAAIAPTCAKSGLTEGRHCANCGEVTLKRKYVMQLDHTPVTDAAKAATCTETGLTKGSHCAVCNTVFVAQKVVKARGHIEYTRQGKAATCTKEGLTDGRYCGSCNLVTVEQTVIPPLGHKETVDMGFAADCTKNGLSDGKHCTVCGYITVPQTVVKASAHNIVDGVCTVCKKNQPLAGEFVNPTHGYITSEATEIVTDHMIFKLPANVYVMDDFVNIVNKVSAAMEEVSGMKFEANPKYCKYNGTAERAYVNVIKTEGTEGGSAYASAMQGAVIAPCDIVDFFALIHETSHILQYRQSSWGYCTWAMEGISTYTTYKTACYINENYPELTIIASTPDHSISNYSIIDYSKLYEQSMEYWMENTFKYSGNNNYSIGFRLMWFLDEVYGDYTKWIYTYEEYRPYHSSGVYNNALSSEEQVKAFKMAYGENVFDEFYAWLKQNEDKFVAEDVTDLREAREINFYPKFMAREWYDLMERIRYRDLCVDLSGGHYYLTDYQNKNISSLKMKVNAEDSAELLLYDAEGSYIRTEHISRSQEIDISGVYYIIFAGEGQIQRFEITGFN